MYPARVFVDEYLLASKEVQLIGSGLMMQRLFSNRQILLLEPQLLFLLRLNDPQKEKWIKDLLREMQNAIIYHDGGNTGSIAYNLEARLLRKSSECL
jgi:hypothetical protein